MSYIDAHCHLADARFDDDRDAVLARAKEAGIGAFIQGGVGPEDWARQLNLKRDGWVLCFGLHPWWVAERNESQCEDGLAALEARLPQAAFLGELGLDYFDRFPSACFPLQQRMFRRQLALAHQHGKPVALHLVRCHEDALAILEEQGPPPRGGLVHAFTASFEIAERYLAMGLLISVGGPVTRPGYRKLKHAVSRLPETALVIESDAPDIPPHGRMGGRNEPAFLWETATAVADLRKTSPEAVLAQSAANLKRCFDKELMP